MGASWAACRERNRALRPHSWERDRGTLQPGGCVAEPRVEGVENWCHEYWEAESTAAGRD